MPGHRTFMQMDARNFRLAAVALLSGVLLWSQMPVAAATLANPPATAGSSTQAKRAPVKKANSKKKGAKKKARKFSKNRKHSVAKKTPKRTGRT